MKILYEDNHIIVVVKDYNIPVQEDSSKDIDLLTMIKNYIKEKFLNGLSFSEEIIELIVEKILNKFK